jgi:hypothetical protein
MPQGLIQPNNAILYAGEPVTQEMEVLTTTEFCPGKLVVTDTNDWDCKAAGATSSTVIGVADVPSDQKLTDYWTSSAGGANTKSFTAGDQIRVLRGDIVVKLIAISGATIAVGTKLISAANGMVTNGTSAGQVIGYSLESPVLTSCCDWVLVKLTI